MFNHRHYVPVLKGKRAEFPALQTLHAHDLITPLFEAVPTGPTDFVPKKMSAFWEDERPYFIDMLFHDDEAMEETEAASHPLSACFAEVAAKNQSAIPVTGTGRSPAYQAAVSAINETQGCGAAIRLFPDDFEDEGDLHNSISALVDYLEIPRDAIDLIVDADTVHGVGAITVRQNHRANLSILPTIDEWRTLTVVSGAFPLSMAPLERETWNPVPRSDWRGWRSLVLQSPLPSRLPAYGDYAIAHPDLPPTGRATILAQLRYTTPNSFLVWKGHNAFTHPQKFGQFNAICADLIEREEYCGQEFSAGDAEIYAKATTQDSPGSAETWRKIATNHHIEMVIDQIANLP